MYGIIRVAYKYVYIGDSEDEGLGFYGPLCHYDVVSKSYLLSPWMYERFSHRLPRSDDLASHLSSSPSFSAELYNKSVSLARYILRTSDLATDKNSRVYYFTFLHMCGAIYCHFGTNSHTHKTGPETPWRDFLRQVRPRRVCRVADFAKGAQVPTRQFHATCAHCQQNHSPSSTNRIYIHSEINTSIYHTFILLLLLLLFINATSRTNWILIWQNKKSFDTFE